MEQDRVQRYAESLERTIRNNYHYLKKTIDDFQDMCRMVTPERNIPAGILIDIREMYKEIRSRLSEVKAIEQLLQGKYRQYYKRDSMRDKEIMEFGFIAKNCYSKFEYTIVQIEAMKRLKEHAPKVEHPSEPFQWFRSKENQVALIKNLRMLMELDYESTPEEVGRGETGNSWKSNPYSLPVQRGFTLPRPSPIPDPIARTRYHRAIWPRGDPWSFGSFEKG